MSYTVNIKGEHANTIKNNTPYNAYDANNVTAIETKETTKAGARKVANHIIKSLQLNSKIYYIFE